MVEPEPEPLNVWEEGTSPSSPLSSVSSFQQMRKQRHRKLQASQEHRREGRRLQAECHELRRRVEELALLESLLLKHISKEIYGTLKPKSRNLSKENSPVSEIAAEKSPEGFIHHSEQSLKELAAENVIKEDPGILKKLQQELSQIQSLATHERAALDRATRKLESHFLEQRVYTEMEEDERALKDSEVEESRLKTASVERELRSLSRDIARLEQLCQDLGDDLGTFSCKARNGSGKGVTAQNDNEEISKIQKNPVLVELERLQGEKAELEKEAKDRHGILGMHHGNQGSMEFMLARPTGFDKGVHWSTTSSEFDSKCLEDDYGLASYSGEISSVNSTTSETLMPKHEGRSNSLSSVTKRLDFGAPETDLNLMEPPGSMNISDRSGKAFIDVNRDDGEVEDGWGEIEDLNSDAKDLGLELQKMEADSHTTHILVQLQNAREEFEQEISDVKDSIAGETEEYDNEWTWGSQEEEYQASNDPSNLEQFVPEMAEPYSASPMDGNVLMQDFELAKSGSAVDKLKGIAFESREIVPPKNPQIANEEKRINESSSPDMDGKDSVDNSELPLFWKMDKNVEPSDSRDSTLLLQENQLPEAGNIDELVRGTAHEKDEMCCIDMSELPQLRNQNERGEISSAMDQSISWQEPEAGNWDRLLEGTVHDMDGVIPPDILALPPHRSQDEEGKGIASDTDQNVSLQEPEAGNRDELLDGTVHNMDKTFPPDILALPPHRNQDEEGKEILSDRDWNQSIEHEFLQVADEENFAVEEIFEGNANDGETFPVDMSELPPNKDEIETISSKREESISLQEHESSQVHDVSDLGKTSPDVNANPTPEVSESHKLTENDNDNSELPSEMGQQNTLQEHGNADDLLKEIASEIQEPNFFLQEEDEEFMLHEHVIHESGTTDEKVNEMGIEFDVTLEDSFNDKVQMLLPQDGGLPQICYEDGKLEEIPFKIEYRTDLLTERPKAEFKGFCDLPYTSASEMLPESEVSKGGKKLLQDHALSQSRDAGDKLDGMSPDYEDAGASSRSMNKAKLSEDIGCSKNQAEKLRGLIGPIDELANDIQRQQKLQEELDQRLDIDYKEWVQNEAQQEALREALPVSVMPWSEETEKVSLILEHQQVLLQNQVEEAEKLQRAAEKRVNTLNDQIQDLEVICDVAQSIESVVICKDEALQFMLWTIVQALLLWLSLLVWLNRFMDPMEGSLHPT